MKELWEELKLVLDTIFEMIVDLYDLLAKWIKEAISDIAFFMLIFFVPVFIGSVIWTIYLLW